jgi:RND family efflux transporter MFP subunit
MRAAGTAGGAALAGRRPLSVSVAAWTGAAILVASVIGGLLLVLPRVKTPSPPAYQMAIVARGSVEGTLVVPARLEAEHTVRVGTVAAGHVVSVAVAVGDRVVRGQILARLDDLEQRRKVDIEEAQLGVAELRGVQAEKRLTEMVRSLEGDGISRDDIDLENLMSGALGDAQLALLATASQINAQKSALLLAKELAGRRVVRAPLAGVVLETALSRGETVAASPPGPPLFVIAPDLSQLILRAEVDDRHVAAIRPGPAAFGLRGAVERPFRGTVRRSASADPFAVAPPRHEVVLDVANPSEVLKPGLRTVVALPMHSDPHALYVARAAVTREPDGGPAGTVAFVEGDGHLRFAPVELGVANEAFVEVRGAGLAPGARVFLPR